MNLKADLCYRAVRSRDARFDGRFFTAVVTTGVYCRPICPARTPKRENVRFYSCAAAAEEAGYRPCRRCRPETAPGTPAWAGTSATVTRALRYIAEGALNDGSVEDLAQRLGLGARQLRRLFLEHVGATPRAVSQTQRAHFARKLCDETSLPMTELAFAAGYESVRQFNAAFKSTFGRAPSELRRTLGLVPPVDGALRLRLPYRAPYDWAGLIGFLAPRAMPGVEVVGKDFYRRSIAQEGTPETPGWLEVGPGDDDTHLVLSLAPTQPKRLIRVVQRIRRLFDLEADPSQIRERLSRDPAVASAVHRRPGLRLPGAWDGFELAVRAILGQQVTVSGATTLSGRLVRAFGTPLPLPHEGITHLFPSAARLCGANVGEIGLPAARARAIRALAEAVREGALPLDGSGDPDEVVSRLQQIPGVGAWTAQYIAMRALHEPDAFPAGDLGLRRALSDSGRPISEREASRRAEIWRPWRAYAAMYLWTMGKEDRT
jgi:AraC family transcriptional regulator, regulatory protein of adaptative response / DNA-3-methyladenine glycosylase II